MKKSKRIACVGVPGIVFGVVAFAAVALLPRPAHAIDEVPIGTKNVGATDQGGTAEDWKGQPDIADTEFGLLAGLGIVNEQAGFAVIPMISKKLIERGFVGGEINDSVWIEAQAGPIFDHGTTVFFYSAHLRWDFVENPTWTLYALGGAGGDITGAALGDHFELFPRFGLGAVYSPTPVFRLRAEISHELIALGFVVPF